MIRAIREAGGALPPESDCRGACLHSIRASPALERVPHAHGRLTVHLHVPRPVRQRPDAVRSAEVWVIHPGSEKCQSRLLFFSGGRGVGADSALATDVRLFDRCSLVRGSRRGGRGGLLSLFVNCCVALVVCRF